LRTQSTDPAPAVLEVEELSKGFAVGGRVRKAVNEVSFAIRRGEVLGLVGESGSGKSTVARLIAQLYPRSGGQVRLKGEELPVHLNGRQTTRLRRQVQMIFQDPYASLNPFHTVGYILSRPLAIHHPTSRQRRREAVCALLERVGLKPGIAYIEKRAQELSGGQRQRVGIARALAAQPDLVLADEPTSMLDVSIRLDIMNLLLELRAQEGLALLFITHDLAGARYMADRVAVLYAGYLVEIGPAERVIGDPQHPYTQLLRQAAPKPEQGLVPVRVEDRGEVPDLSNLPPGCPFQPRCPLAKPECYTALPRMYAVGSDHLCRCVLHAPEVQPEQRSA
jgi:peptide/nickel transport system ATP-binding protein